MKTRGSSQTRRQWVEGGGAVGSVRVRSQGRQIHNSKYNNPPAPKYKKETMKPILHIQDGIGVALPKPPQTPPIHLSVDDTVALFKFSHALIKCSCGYA